MIALHHGNDLGMNSVHEQRETMADHCECTVSHNGEPKDRHVARQIRRLGKNFGPMVPSDHG
jgi:hypothetical protein